MANRKRPIRLKFRVTEAEKKKIKKRMTQAKIDNQEAYVRKMAIDGYVVQLELPELTQAVNEFKVISKRFNEIAKRVNSTGRIYPEDISEMKSMFQKMLNHENRILEKLKDF